MASIFDGMAGLLSGVFGDTVRYLPEGGAARDIQSIFREAPTEAVDRDGHPVLIVAPSWRVERHLVPEIAHGDKVQPGNGKTYIVLNPEPSGSPAEDGFLICELEREFT